VRRLILLSLLPGLALLACARDQSPEETALDYSRALYASDAERQHRLLSAADRRAKDIPTLAKEREAPSGFAAELVGRLARHIQAEVVKSSVDADRATVTLRLALPDANAGPVSSLALEWDEARLEALPPGERTRRLDAIGRLAEEGQLPTVSGEETLQLVREEGRWRVWLNIESGVALRFQARNHAPAPLRITFLPEQVKGVPGERVHVAVKVENLSAERVVVRVRHRVEPEAAADRLAVLRCPLFLPVAIAPGQTEEFESLYLLSPEAHSGPHPLEVIYEFVPEDAAARS
jgi:hypothetical protein